EGSWSEYLDVSRTSCLPFDGFWSFGNPVSHRNVDFRYPLISGSSEDLSAPLLCTARYLCCYADDVLPMQQRISDAPTPDVLLKFSPTCLLLFRIPCRCMSGPGLRR
ncbi:unnamed protein product, partial [Ectocarpus sp. 13 AM-2016]